MATPTEVDLSGSTDGEMIPVAATATPGTTIHTAGAAGFDKLYLFAVNTDSAQHTLTLEWGGVSDPSDHALHAYPIEANSALVPLALGLRISNSKVVKAFADSASKINVCGFAVRVV